MAGRGRWNGGEGGGGRRRRGGRGPRGPPRQPGSGRRGSTGPRDERNMDARAARGGDRPAGAERWVTGRRIAPVEVRHPRAVAATCPARCTSRPCSPDGRIAGHRRRGKYLWLPLTTGRDRRPPRHVRPAAAAAGRRADEIHLRVRFTLRRRRTASCASSTSAPSAVAVPREGGAALPDEIAHIARDPFDPVFADTDVRSGCAGGAPRSSGRCWTRR